jgi:hypothetical protein
LLVAANDLERQIALLDEAQYNRGWPSDVRHSKA